MFRAYLQFLLLLAALFGFCMGIFRVSPRLLRRLCGQFYVGLVRILPPLEGQFISTIRIRRSSR